MVNLCELYEYEDVHVMQDAQDDRSQICLNYVTKWPNVIATISRKIYCCLFWFLVLV